MYSIFECNACKYVFDVAHHKAATMLVVCPNDFTMMNQIKSDYHGQNDAICDRCNGQVHCVAAPEPSNG